MYREASAKRGGRKRWYTRDLRKVPKNSVPKLGAGVPPTEATRGPRLHLLFDALCLRLYSQQLRAGVSARPSARLYRPWWKAAALGHLSNRKAEIVHPRGGLFQKPIVESGSDDGHFMAVRGPITLRLEGQVVRLRGTFRGPSCCFWITSNPPKVF